VLPSFVRTLVTILLDMSLTRVTYFDGTLCLSEDHIIFLGILS